MLRCRLFLIYLFDIIWRRYFAVVMMALISEMCVTYYTCDHGRMFMSLYLHLRITELLAETWTQDYSRIRNSGMSLFVGECLIVFAWKSCNEYAVSTLRFQLHVGLRWLNFGLQLGVEPRRQPSSYSLPWGRQILVRVGQRQCY